MQCEDNSKLRIPLPEVCQTTDIGCVPIVDGKPTCTPQPDELPFAFDPKTATLWIFSCKTREWLDFTKFNVCQLDALNLDNITNICDILNIAVNYSGSGECKQGTITLAELAERILECLKLETKIITIGEGEGNKVKITIEGLPLDPVYVTGRNIWSEGGSGTEADPLKVATYDPICKWPVKTQANVDAASVKHLGACLDGEMSRVPFPPKVCELPSKNQAQVDASTSVELIACVDGEGSKIPYPSPCGYPQMTEEQVEKATDINLVACVDGNNVKVPYPEKPCEYPELTSAQVMAAADKDFIACVDGQNVKFPIPGNLYDASLCQYPEITLDEAKNYGTSLTLGACAGGREVRIPVYGSGFFSTEYLCVPMTDGQPVGNPFPNTGPFRIDCEGTLWVWDCSAEEGQGTWRRAKDGIGGSAGINPAAIPDICNNLRMKGWFANNADPCVQDVQITLSQLVDIIEDCRDSKISCKQPFTSDRIVVHPRTNPEKYPDSPARYAGLTSVNLVNLSSINPDIETYGRNIAIYNWATGRWEYGSGTFQQARDAQGVGYATHTFTNDTNCTQLIKMTPFVQIGQRAGVRSKSYSVCVISKMFTEGGGRSWDTFIEGEDGKPQGGGPTNLYAIANWHSKDDYNVGLWGSAKHLMNVVNNTANRPIVRRIDPGESRTYSVATYLVISSSETSISENVDPPILHDAGSGFQFEIHRGIRVRN